MTTRSKTKFISAKWALNLAGTWLRAARVSTNMFFHFSLIARKYYASLKKKRNNFQKTVVLTVK